MRILRLISHTLKSNPQNPNTEFLDFFIKPMSFPIQRYTTSSIPQSTSTPTPTQLPPPSDAIKSIADEIADLTLIEVADLTTLLSKKLEIKDVPLVSLMMPGMGFRLTGMGGGAGGGGGEAKAGAEEKKEKTAFDLKLQAGFEAGVKIKIIKEVRTFTDLGLKEAKELVEKAPAVLKTGVSKEEAEKIVEKMKAIGATVVLE